MRGRVGGEKAYVFVRVAGEKRGEGGPVKIGHLPHPIYFDKNPSRVLPVVK